MFKSVSTTEKEMGKEGTKLGQKIPLILELYM